MARLVVGVNDLATLRPDLAAELVDQTLATQLTVGSHKKVDWCCKAHGHVWVTTVNGRSTGNGCPYCSGRLATVGVNDLATLRPDLAAELVDQTLATQLTVSSNKKVGWCCKEQGHVWAAVVASRASGRGCSYCLGRRVTPGVNDLATTRPDLAAELVDQTLATQLTVSSNKKVGWCCKAHGHVWAANVGDRSGRGNGCPYCSGRLATVGVNDLATLRPDLAAELVDQTLATQLTVGSSKQPEWRCKEQGHIWSAAVKGRSTRGRGCPYCAGKAVLPGFNDLLTVRPDLAAELVDQTLATQLAGTSHKSVEWCCKAHEHIWVTSVNARSAGNGCPYCSGRTVLAGFNDLATLRPDLAAELVDQTLATQLAAGTHEKAQWRCKEQGHIWRAEVNSRSGGRGCPECATYGFSPASIGWLYLLATPGRRVFKFGITNDLETRLDNHYKQGFTEHVEELLFEYGGDAVDIETALLRHKKAMGWHDGMTKADMPDGYTETLLADDCGEDFTLSGFIATLPAAND